MSARARICGMKIPTRALGALVGVLLWLTGAGACSLLEPEIARLCVPRLPVGLAFLEPRIAYRASGSCLADQTVRPGGTLVARGYCRDGGDWICLEPLSADGLAETGLPILGWVRAGGDGCGVDAAAGAVAWQLKTIERAGGSWEGLQLDRYLYELRRRGLDSLDLDLAGLARSVALRAVTSAEFAPAKRNEAAAALPAGVWLDGRGRTAALSDGTPARVSAPVRGGRWYRAEPPAVLDFGWADGPDGKPALVWVAKPPP